MAEKKLQMVFLTAGGDKATMTLSECKQDLVEATTKSAMQSMCDSMAFANGDGDLFDVPVSASYIETTETAIFTTDSQAKMLKAFANGELAYVE